MQMLPRLQKDSEITTAQSNAIRSINNNILVSRIMSAGTSFRDGYIK